jgi:thiosulfate dehydrogenase
MRYKTLANFAGIFALFVLFSYYFGYKQVQSLYNLPENCPVTLWQGPDYYEFTGPNGRVRFDLLDPAMAPPEIHDQVMYGYKIMCNTRKHASEFTGDRLDCKNCHFAAGNTFGGPGGGISLVGVTEIYPRYSSRNKMIISLKDRINNCFTRSMNGKRVPDDHEVMTAILAYLEWISRPVAKVKSFPWLGLPDMTNKHTPNPDNGALVFHTKCATCHGSDGSGKEVAEGICIPPLWGDQSFNEGAGMAMLSFLAPFIHLNMPYEEPTLNEEDAIDVASFLIKQPRPAFFLKKP